MAMSSLLLVLKPFLLPPRHVPICSSTHPTSFNTCRKLNLNLHTPIQHNVLRKFTIPNNLPIENKTSQLNAKAKLVEASEAKATSEKKIPLLDVVVKRKRQVFSRRKWNFLDIEIAGGILAMHLLSLLAPFYFSWSALWVAIFLYVVTGLFGITLSYHRNLSHRSFKLSKPLEYLFAYCGVMALQCEKPNNVGDLQKQPFYRFLQSTYHAHPIALVVQLYLLGGVHFLVWGMGVRIVWIYHITWLVNLVCHVWGKQAWNTGDLSRNNWWVAILSFGEGWHNNHHAFEYSARHGLEWWQLDMTWYVVRLLQILGLATDVKLPNEAQKERLALNTSTAG
ncbi:hypothetical protein BT93_G2239 [Corymbia citriodora subsp. variegata]|nr:hypothetical protein BT93_G2239 [Corymbia citriodora subsp. variegata]